jgi:hypothetical protein
MSIETRVGWGISESNYSSESSSQSRSPTNPFEVQQVQPSSLENLSSTELENNNRENKDQSGSNCDQSGSN